MSAAELSNVVQGDERAERIRRVLAACTSQNTRDAQANDLRGLAAWQESQGLKAGLPLSPQEFLAWLDHLVADRGFKSSTVARKACSVSKAHKRLAMDSPISHPIVADYLRGLPRCSEPQAHARPLRIEQLYDVVKTLAQSESSATR